MSENRAPAVAVTACDVAGLALYVSSTLVVWWNADLERASNV